MMSCINHIYIKPVLNDVHKFSIVIIYLKCNWYFNFQVLYMHRYYHVAYRRITKLASDHSLGIEQWFTGILDGDA